MHAIYYTSLNTVTGVIVVSSFNTLLHCVVIIFVLYRWLTISVVPGANHKPYPELNRTWLNC